MTATNTVGTSAVVGRVERGDRRCAGRAHACSRSSRAPTQGKKGALKVSFHAGAANGGTITQYRATCTPVSTGLDRRRRRHRLADRGAESPGRPRLRRARWSPRTSSARARSRTRSVSQRRDTRRAAGSSGSCASRTVWRWPSCPAQANGSADHQLPGALHLDRRRRIREPAAAREPDRREPADGRQDVHRARSPRSTTAARARPPRSARTSRHCPTPQASNLASCTGRSGNLRVSPGLLLDVNKPHTLRLSATFGQCSGPYVKAAKLAPDLPVEDRVQLQERDRQAQRRIGKRSPGRRRPVSATPSAAIQLVHQLDSTATSRRPASTARSRPGPTCSPTSTSREP